VTATKNTVNKVSVTAPVIKVADPEAIIKGTQVFAQEVPKSIIAKEAQAEDLHVSKPVVLKQEIAHES